jgi:hypothetical protein
MADFGDAVAGLMHGDFSRLEPLFDGDSPQIVQWINEGRLADPKVLAEALTCACFLGCTRIAEKLLSRHIDPASGNATGLDALHWAANRGQVDAVRMLIRHKAPLETRSMYNTTVLGTAVWSAINEPRPDHLKIIEDLVRAGARVEAISYPTGRDDIDSLLRKS